MGQPMPPVPHVYGLDCLRGFPAGKTPKYMYARFSGMVQCPDWPPRVYDTPPNDRVFKLTQNPDIPCQWFYTTPTLEVYFSLVLYPFRPVLVLAHTGPFWYYFRSETFEIFTEGTVYNNQYQECVAPSGAAGGIATVTWTQEATDLLESLNIQRADDLFMELRPLVDGNKVYKFCRLRDATNISIEFEPD